MLHRWIKLCVVCLALVATHTANAKQPAAAPTPATALADYVSAPDGSYHWKLRRSGKFAQGSYVELTLTSQTWRNQKWRHQLYIYRPSKVTPTAGALMLINGGSWNDSLAEPAAEGDHNLPSETILIAQVAEALQTPVAILCQVPEQPLFDGLREDAAISYTFTKFVETGDVDWPLLLPMVKSAVRAMDAVEEFAGQQWELEIDTFLITGASKRGWTTWLTAAVDPRVSALAPLVINMLNMEPHMELQQASFGGLSDEIRDYTERGMHKLMKSPRGVELRTIVDPYSYLQQISQPKLIILGTNDRYWPVDSLNLYWNALAGEKHILYVPNNGHDITDYPRVIGAIAALYRSANVEGAMPKFDWQFDEEQESVHLQLSLEDEPLEVVAWSANSPTRDFRTSRWTSQAAAANSKQSYSIKFPRPSEGYAALFAEVKFPGKPLPVHLSSGLRVVEPAARDSLP